MEENEVMNDGEVEEDKIKEEDAFEVVKTPLFYFRAPVYYR